MALTKIVKRDGTIVDFDRSKIENAIMKAMFAVDFDEDKKKPEAEKMTSEVVEELAKAHADGSYPSVEEVQDVVERIIIKNNYPELAKAYILYRKQHQDLREGIAMFNEIDLIDSYLYQKDWFVKENSNESYSLQGLNFYITSKIVSKYWLNKIYPQEAKRAHISGDFHIHQMGVLGPYCVGWDLRDLLMRGFRGAPGKIESKPPKHLRTALLQMVNFFYTLQGESAGAQAFSNFDTYLAPFVRHDNLSYEEVKQAMQEFVFNMNVPTRVGFQTPFTNLTLDLKVPKYMQYDQYPLTT